jgi:glycosyltransferase involved in cell wall biosynthesis
LREDVGGRVEGWAMPDNRPVTPGVIVHLDAEHQVADERLARSEQELAALRREIAVLQNSLADLQVQSARHAPLLDRAAFVLSGTRIVADKAMAALRTAGALADIPATAKRLSEARLRSERLVKDRDGRWTPQLDVRAYLVNASRALGLSRPPIYNVNPKQRLGLRYRPRILHVIPNVWVGGSTQLILDLHDYLGHRLEMKILTSALPRRERHQGMKIMVVPRAAPPFEVRSIFTGFNPHIVHVHYWGDVDEPWYKPLFEMASELGYPIVQNVNTPVAPYAAVPIARNVFVSQTVLDTFGSAPPARVIHPGVDLSLFAPPARTDPSAYDAIGMVYRLEPDKLNEGSIEPLIAVVKRRPQTRAIIVGDGALFSHFRARVAEERLLDRFEFTGAVPYSELPSQYARFKVFVAPVWQESFGQVVPFAMSMGLAVAGNRVGALPEILGDSSLLAAPPRELADHVLRLLDDRDAIDAVGRRNRAIAGAAFSVERMAVDYLDLYRSVVPERVELMPDYPPAVDFPL